MPKEKILQKSLDFYHRRLTFIIDGTITGNQAVSGVSGEVAGVLVEGSGSRLDQTGGSITGNTNTNATFVYPNVRLTDGATRTVNGEPAGNS